MENQFYKKDRRLIAGISNEGPTHPFCNKPKPGNFKRVTLNTQVKQAYFSLDLSFVWESYDFPFSV